MVADQLEYRRVATDALIAVTPSRVLFSLAISLGVWFLASNEYTPYANAWMVGVLWVSAVRIAVHGYFLKPEDKLSDHARFVLFNSLLALNLAVWGLAGWALFIPGDETRTALLVVLMTVVAAGGAYSYITSFTSSACFTVPLMFSLACCLGYYSGEYHALYLLSIVMLVAAVLVSSNRNQQLLFSEHVHRQEVEREMLLDPLTKLANRAGYHRQMHYLRESMMDSDTYAGLMMLNIDRFKEVNNTHGYQYGDMVLLAFSQRLHQIMPDDGIVCRLNGDEFAILLPQLGADEQDAKLAVSDVCNDILEDCLNHYEVHDEDFFLEVSIGAVVFNAESAADGELLKYSDLALEEAKEAGRNCFMFYDMEMSIRMENDSWLFRELREGVKKKEFIPHYQPVFCVSSNQLKGAEVLLRWQKPSGDVVAAGQFIHLLENSSLMPDLSRDIMRQVCAQVSVWFRDEQWDVEQRVMFNLSPLDLRDEVFVDLFFSLLRQYGLPASIFEFEMTERELFQQTNRLMDQLTRLKDAGASLAIDDFGTGYSGLNYLKNMPADTLKIDKVFVDGMLTERYDRLLVTSIIGICEEMDMHTIAEGIETQEQLDLLKKLQCDCYQGYLASRPLSGEALTELLAAKA